MVPTPASTPTDDQMQAFSNYLLDLYQLDRSAGRAAFVDRVFDRYGQLISHDAGLWGGGRKGYDRGLVMHYAHLHRLPAAEVVTNWERPANGQERLRLVLHMEASLNRALIVNADTPGLGAAFAQLFGAHGIRHLLGIYLFDPAAQLFNIVSLYRICDTPFTEAERRLHELAAPHIVTVLRDHTIRSLDSPGASVEARTFAAAVDVAGTLHHAHPEFLRLIGEEWPGWQGPDIPRVLVPGSASASFPRPFVGNTIVIHATPRGELFHFTARRKSAVDELTLREREVADAFAGGQSHKEVARRLGIAPSTVRNNLFSIYKKLGVSDKAALARLLAATTG